MYRNEYISYIDFENNTLLTYFKPHLSSSWRPITPGDFGGIRVESILSFVRVATAVSNTGVIGATVRPGSRSLLAHFPWPASRLV